MPSHQGRDGKGAGRTQRPKETLLASRTAGGVQLFDWDDAPLARFPFITCPEPTICIVVTGGHVEHHVIQRHGVRTKVDVCVDAAGTALSLRSPGLRHGCTIGRSGHRMVAIRIGPDASSALRTVLAGAEGSGPVLAGVEFRAMGRRLQREMRRPGALGDLGIEATVAELAYLIGRRAAGERSERRPPPWLMLIHQQLREECRGPTPTLTTLARVADRHPASLAREFRHAFGYTPAGWIRECRLQWARDALADSARSLSTVAHEAGFADHSHFTRAFRGRFGVTPSEWRCEIGNT